MKSTKAGRSQGPNHTKRTASLTAIGAFTAVALWAAMVLVQPLGAQTLGTGSIQGTVEDSSGAVIAGAQVIATNIGTNLKTAEKSSGSGFYVLPNLQEGDYKLDVSASGFAGFEEQVHVEALAVVGLNIVLKVGEQTEKVQVSASEQPMLNTENGQVEDIIPAETYDDLPVGMGGGTKSPTAYLSLSPGVTSNGNSSSDGFGLDFDGGVPMTSQLYINGLPLVSSELFGGWENLTSVMVEDVSSFQVMTSGIPAYYDGQGIANLVYKTGTNQFHGDIFENSRNTDFDAKYYFTDKRGVEHQNEYGIAGGGPFKKNRIWFFGSYDKFKYDTTSSPSVVTVPTVGAQGGDFSGGYQTIYDPATTFTNTDGSMTRCAFGQTPVVSAGYETCSGSATNVIPKTRFSSVASILESAGLPQIAGPITDNYSQSVPSTNQQWTEFGKADWRVTKNNTLSGLVEYSRGGGTAWQQLPGPYGSNRYGPSTEWMGQLNDTQIITNNLINIFAVGFTRNGGVAYNPSDNTGWTTKAGITGLPPGTSMVTQFPMVSFTGGNAPPTGWDINDPDFAEIPYSEVIQDNFQWMKGKHAFTFGGQMIFQYEQLEQPPFWGGNGLGFTNSETGNFCPASGISPVTGAACTVGKIDPATGDPYASFLLGLVDNAAIDDNTVAITGGRWKNYALYVQDDWKFTPKLTLNLGLRYIIPRPFTEAHDRWSDFNPLATNPITGTPGVIQFGGFGPASCDCHSDVKTHYLTFGPRVGFAYSVNNKTVVRSAFAIVHFNGGILGGNGTQQGPGVLGFSSDPAWASTDGGIEPAFELDHGFQNPTIYPGTTGNTTYTVPPFFSSTLNTGYTTTPGFEGPQGGYEYDRPATAGRSPYTEQWNLTIERQLPSNFVLNLTYAGISGHFVGMNGGVGIYSNQVNPAIFQAPGVGALLDLPANSTNLAALQAALPGAPGLPFATFSGTIGQMLRPFPQYGSSGPVWNGNPDSFSDLGTNSYNALQATVTHTMRNGLYMSANYAWSKELDEAGDTIQFFAQNARSAYNWAQERAVGLSDTPQFFSFVEDYELPIGQGKLLNVDNHVANALVGGWKLAGAEQYSAGNPFTPVVGSCTANNYGGSPAAIGFGGLPGGCYDNYNPAFSGSAKIKKIGTGNPRTDAYFNYHAFDYNATVVNNVVAEPASAAQLTPYSFGNTPRTLAYPSMRGEFYKNENVSLTKTFPFPRVFGENASFVFRADALNIFNRAIFSNPNMNASAGAAGTFGKVTAQENGPRFLQFEGHIRF